jgi:hypothetical protein
MHRGVVEEDLDAVNLAKALMIFPSTIFTNNSVDVYSNRIRGYFTAHQAVQD